MNLIEVMFGEEIFDNQNAKVQVFVCPSKIFNTFSSEIAINAAATKDEIPVQRQTQLERIAAWNSEARADLGSWKKAAYIVQSGMILKVFAHKHSGFGQRTLNVAQFLRINPDAAYQEIKIQLTGHAKARLMFATIKGRFELISLKDATAAGVKVNPNFKALFDESNLKRLITFTVLEKAKPATKVIRNRVRKRGDGSKEVQQVQRKIRTLELDDE